MTLWAIVPVKPLSQGKSRLKGVLTQQERAELNQGMLLNTLAVLSQVPRIEQIVVVSRDTKALALARQHGAKTIAERGSPSLNGALTRATTLAAGKGATAVLILPADLPLIEAADLKQLIVSAAGPPSVVIAPDRHGSGTNALLLSPPGLLEYEFGPDSFTRHLERAERVDAKIAVCDLPALALDLDAPEDLEIYRSHAALVKE